MGTQKVKPTGALKAFLKTDKSTRVIGAVERHIISRPKDDRSTTVIHPSEMASASWCHRAQYFWLQGETPAPEVMSLRRALIFAHGHAIHDIWQTWFTEMDQIKGKWFCSSCKDAWFGLASDHEADEFCKIKYNEVPVYHKPLRISGKADGWLVGFGDSLLLEVKSIGEGSIRWYAPDIAYDSDNDFKKMWANVNAPFLEHIMQAQIYMKLMELMELKDAPQEAVLIYEAKGLHEIKEFVVRKSDFGVADLFEAAANIISAVDKGTPPLCNINGATGCKKCSHYIEENQGEPTSN
jgi:hypothetical protein